jgi:4-carboxymuconolactone decarboxylase
MARIAFPAFEDLTPEQRRVHDEVVRTRGKLHGPLRAALHNPELADKWQQLGELLRYRTSLPTRLSELAILVTARHFDCQFEWYAHEAAALAGGLAPAVIDAIRHGLRPRFANHDEELIYEYSIVLQRTHFVDDGRYQAVLAHFGTLAIVELTALLGYYAMVAMTLNAHEIPMPAGTANPMPAATATTQGENDQ